MREIVSCPYPRRSVTCGVGLKVAGTQTHYCGSWNRKTNNKIARQCEVTNDNNNINGKKV